MQDAKYVFCPVESFLCEIERLIRLVSYIAHADVPAVSSGYTSMALGVPCGRWRDDIARMCQKVFVCVYCNYPKGMSASMATES